MREMAQEWVKAAADDLAAISAMINDDNLTNIAAFHAQQAVEKALKALIENNGESIPRKHDLLLLYSKVSSLLTIKDESVLDILNQLYTEARYPSEFGLLPHGKPTHNDAKKLFVFAKDIVRKATNILSKK
jgi:HEPN domain-containing protein